MTSHLARMTWTQAAEALREGPVILIPLGAQEPHGPHMPMGLDFLVAEHLAETAAARTGALIAPTLPYGYCASVADYPGAVTLRGETLIAVVEDTLRSLTRHGASHLMLIDNHRGNHPFVEAAARRIREETGALIASFFPWGTIINHAPAHYENFGAVFGHGGEPETSTALHLFGPWVDMSRARADAFAPYRGQPMKSAAEAQMGKAAVSLWVRNSEISRTGTKGDPTVATAERGRALVEAAVGELVAAIEAFKRIPAEVTR
jgi:creatinine amidohydrolase